MIEGFKKMDTKKQESYYGGWAWLVALTPLLLQSVVTTVASIKSIFSDKGSIKGKDISATWDDREPVVTKAPKKEPQPQQTINYFAY